MTNWYTAHFLHHVLGRASRDLPDGWQVNTLYFWLHNNLDSGAFRGAQAQWDKITVPMFSVGNWSGFGLHLRGTITGRQSSFPEAARHSLSAMRSASALAMATSWS